jgi:hypothetical protein
MDNFLFDGVCKHCKLLIMNSFFSAWKSDAICSRAITFVYICRKQFIAIYSRLLSEYHTHQFTNIWVDGLLYYHISIQTIGE